MSIRKWSEEKIAELFKEGRGQGSGAEYTPWLNVRSFSSCGFSHRIWSPKTGRRHDLLSNNELHVFLAAEWDRAVIDIREQFPLPREATLLIAERSGVRHPYYPGTHVPCVMTVDFLLTKKNDGAVTEYAIDVKSDEQSADPRSLEKLEITRQYFASRGIGYAVIYHRHIPFAVTGNIQWIRLSVIQEHEAAPESRTSEETLERMRELYARRAWSDRPLRLLCEEFDALYGNRVGTGLHVARLLMHRRDLIPDLSRSRLESAPLSSFGGNRAQAEQLHVGAA